MISRETRDVNQLYRQAYFIYLLLQSAMHGTVTLHFDGGAKLQYSIYLYLLETNVKTEAVCLAGIKTMTKIYCVLQMASYLRCKATKMAVPLFGSFY